MSSKLRFISLAIGVLFFAAAVLSVLLISRRSMHDSGDIAGQPKAARTTNQGSTNPSSPLAASSATTNVSGSAGQLFATAYETSFAKWTGADGKDTNIIRQLAHNPLEYQRMVAENPRIFRRQLVYLKETAASVFEQAKLTGATVQQLTLPALDGRELQFDIVKRESSGGLGSSRQGMFSGHLAGNNDSLVTLAFEDGRQAFTVLSPKDNIYLVGEPRENGQVIVKEIDPNTYGVGPADADDVVKTNSTP